VTARAPVPTAEAPAGDVVHLIRCCDNAQTLCGTPLPAGSGPAVWGGTDCPQCRTVLMSSANCGDEYCPGWSR